MLNKNTDSRAFICSQTFLRLIKNNLGVRQEVYQYSAVDIVFSRRSHSEETIAF